MITVNLYCIHTSSQWRQDALEVANLNSGLTNFYAPQAVDANMERFWWLLLRVQPNLAVLYCYAQIVRLVVADTFNLIYAKQIEQSVIGINLAVAIGCVGIEE